MTKIQWCDKTWNPIIGCSKISEGCSNCYAIDQAWRNRAIALNRPPEARGRLRGYVDAVKKEDHGINWTGDLVLLPEALEIPFEVKKPTTWFVNSMGDLFHENIPYDWIDQVMETMLATYKHRYMVLTKRPERMADYCQQIRQRLGLPSNPKFPIPNLWLGVSIENNRVSKRLSGLMKTNCPNKFLSCEPLLETLHLAQYPEFHCIKLVIAGGESGANARICNLEWAVELAMQCIDAGVPFFFKQAGSNVQWQGVKLKFTTKHGDVLEELPKELQPILKRCRF